MTHLIPFWLLREPYRQFFWLFCIIAGVLAPVWMAPPNTEAPRNSLSFVGWSVVFALFPLATLWLIHRVRRWLDRSVTQQEATEGIEPEDFGWLVWMVESLYAIAYGYHTVCGKMKSEKGYTEPVPEAVFTEAAPKLLLAAATGVIVVFVARYYAKFWRWLPKLERLDGVLTTAQENLKQTSQRSQHILAVVERDAALSALSVVIDRFERYPQSTELARFMEEARTATLGLYKPLSTLLPKLKDNDRELVSFMALYTSYCRTETIRFEREPGEGVCTFATRFPHYALAVRSVLRCLNALALGEERDATRRSMEIHQGRFEYYALSNKAPLEWLAWDVGSAMDPAWCVFLERFALCLRIFDAPWTRYFLVRDNDKPRATTARYRKVLCVREPVEFTPTRGGPRVIVENVPLPVPYWSVAAIEEARKANPYLWEENAQPEQLLTQFHSRVAKYGPAVREFVERFEPGKTFRDGPMLAIFDSDREVPAKAVLDGVNAKQGAAQPPLEAVSVKDVVTQTYHSPSRPPKLRFFDAEEYRSVFHDGAIMDDLFAVWDVNKNDWVLSIGISGEIDGAAVNLIYASETMSQGKPSWSEIKTALTHIFRDTSQGSLEDI